MRILIAGTNRTLKGGAEAYQQALIPALVAAGHAVGLFYEQSSAGARSTADSRPGGIAAWGVSDLGVERAVSAAAQWDPGVVYLQGLSSPALEARLLNRWPGVLFAHDYYGACETGTKRHAFPRIAMCTRALGPACLALHYVRRCGGLSPLTMTRMYRLQAARHALLRRYRALCVASNHMRAEFLRQGVHEQRLHVLHLPPNGITRDPAPPAPRPASHHVVMAARLTNLKGGDVLLDALPLAEQNLRHSLSLTVLGDGPERHRLEARARAAGVSAQFLGWTDAVERNRILRTADLLALPSVWPEPWGLVGLEAACAGVPTVAFVLGGIPEWLATGESGELAPASPPTPEGLADAMVRALRDPEHHARLRRGAWERVAQFTMERHVSELLQVLRAAVG